MYKQGSEEEEEIFTYFIQHRIIVDIFSMWFLRFEELGLNRFFFCSAGTEL